MTTPEPTREQCIEWLNEIGRLEGGENAIICDAILRALRSPSLLPAFGGPNVQRWNAGIHWTNASIADPEMIESDTGSHVRFNDYMQLWRTRAEPLGAQMVEALEAGATALTFFNYGDSSSAEKRGLKDAELLRQLARGGK